MLISERIKEICKSRGISVSKIEKELGFGNGTIGKWGKSGRTPTYDRIYAVAEYLGVPVSELTGEKNTDPQEGAGLSGVKKEIMDELVGLTDAELLLVKERIRKIKESRE